MMRELEDIEAAAYYWWLMKRPLSFSEEQHVANPEVNTVGKAEAQLARAVSRAFATPTAARKEDGRGEAASA